jgi:putative ABC transport system permease protein
MSEVINISLLELAAAAGIVAIAALISYLLRLKLEKEMLIATVRAFVQLMAVGYILDRIFAFNKWYLVSAWLLMMIGIASYNAMRRQTKRFKGLLPRLTLAITSASLISIILGIGLIIRPNPFWSPQYLIPIGGMIIGNAMSAAALAINRLDSEMKSGKDRIEAALSLGASVHIASLPAIKASVRAGMLNVITNTMVVGLVHLPGMMTGQIVGGVVPGEAVRYQIFIMYMLITSNALSSLMSTMLIRGLYFNNRSQLILPE